MPEGHVIHRHARLQNEKFVGKPLAVSSPQGRFAAGARELDGRSIELIEARGKHLFYTWDHDMLLHIHLGLFGRFRVHNGDAPPPSDGTRLTFESAAETLYLSGPTICALIDDEQRQRVVSKLGPDPLAYESDSAANEHLMEYLSRRKSPIAVSLLDQQVVAGIGNVYRSELLFLTGVHPLTPSSEVTDEEVESLWSESVSQLRLGEKSGRIVTTRPVDFGVRSRSRIRSGQRTYVYKRVSQPCRVCHTPIERTELANRKVWWCPNCQPR